MKICRLLALLTLVLVSPAHAQGDPRIVEEAYDPDLVYAVSISQGNATVIQLERGEAVESIVVGDADGWLVEATASADRVVVKPVQGAGRTNMILLTTKRSYAFTLDAMGGADTFLLKFRYGPETRSSAEAGATYRFRGSRSLRPRLITDNGRTTSIYWSPDVPFPAVFTIDDEGDEVAAEHRAAGDGLILEGIHPQLVFRSGKQKATATRIAGEGRP